MDNRKRTLTITMCALFTALTAVCSQIQIPLPQIPINLALFAVGMAGAILGAGYGALSMTAYVLLGAVGVPVFAGFKGGLAALTGATGGYIIGYIVCAWLVGFIIRHTNDKIYTMIIAMIIGFFACYVFGTAWYMMVSGNPLKVSLTYCVLPFLPGDAIKAILASLVSNRVMHMVGDIYEFNTDK